MNMGINTSVKPARWVVMGVSGCGKSAIGQALADALGAEFLEGDSRHSAANIARMAAGTPLTDADRADWLLDLQASIADAAAAGRPLVLSCSALKRRYRDLLRGGDPALRFIHLDGSPQLIAARMGARKGHFMPPALLASQLRELEPLQADETGLVLDLSLSPQQLLEACLRQRF